MPNKNRRDYTPLIRFLVADPSLLMLLGANLLTLVIAVAEQWRIQDVLWIYWSQSMTIGWFSWLRMRHLTRFSSEGLTIGGAPVPCTPAGARMAANNLLGVHAVFHLCYIVFLCVLTHESSFRHTRQDQLALALCIGSFVLNHWFSYRHNLKDDLTRMPNIGAIGCMPLLRVAPMHITIIACGGLSMAFGGTSRLYSALALIIFLALKTLVDLIMHVIEHQATSGAKPATPAQPNV